MLLTTLVIKLSQCELINNHPEIPRNCNSVSEHFCLLSPEYPGITLNPNAQAFSPLSPMLDLSECPQNEFVYNYNLRCTVDLLADEVVATEIDQEESDSERDDLPGDILQVMTTHDVLTTLVTAVSMKL